MPRRVLALAAAVAVLAGLGLTAMAATVAPPAFSDIAGHEAEGELTIMAALGIMSGDAGLGGPVRPDATITRLEFSKVLVGAIGRSNLAAGLASVRPNVPDAASIAQWGWGWANAALSLGLISGYPDGSFGPNNNVKYSEAVTMLVRAVPGHKEQVGTAQPWPLNYMAYAITNGFTGDLVLDPNLPATRGNIARLLFLMMQIDRKKTDGTVDAGTAYLAGRVYSGLLTAFSAVNATVGGHTATLADSYWIVGGTTLDQIKNLQVRGVKSADGKWVVFHRTVAANVYSGIFSNLNTAGTPDLLVFRDGTTIPYASPVDTTLNSETGHDEGDLLAGDECTVVMGPDGAAVSVMAMRDNVMDYVEVFTPSSSSPPLDTHVKLKGGGAYDIAATVPVYLNGVLSNRNLLADNDVLYIATRGADPVDPPVRVKAIRQVVEGTVTNVQTSYPGPVWRVTIQRTTGGSGTYVLDPTYFLAPPPNGSHVKYGLDAEGEAFVPYAFVPATPYVLVKGATDLGGGNWTVTVDVRGTNTVYPTLLNPVAWIGQYGQITVDGATGRITNFTAMPVVGGTNYTVLAVDTVNKTMTVNDGVTTFFINDPNVVVYRNAAGTRTYIGIQGVSIGWVLKADALRMIWEYTVP